MTNQEILESEIIANKLMTEEELQNYIETYMCLPPYLTYAEWQKRGYQVQKGEKAVIKTKLWLKSKKKIDKSKGNDKDNIDEHFVLVNASLFAPEQVKKIELEDKINEAS